MTISEIKLDLLDAGDGPVTKFVVIYRAMKLACNGKTAVDDLSNSLYECLEDFQEIPSNEFNHICLP